MQEATLLELQNIKDKKQRVIKVIKESVACQTILLSETFNVLSVRRNGIHNTLEFTKVSINPALWNKHSV